VKIKIGSLQLKLEKSNSFTWNPVNGT